MKILVTGGAGFIGSHVVDGFVEAGHEVIVVDDLSCGNINNVNKKAKFYLLDINSPLIENIFKIERPDIVNHHAAQISVPYSVKDPIYDANINVLGFLNVLENSVKYNVKKVIFISSGGAIYGEADEYPTTENYMPKPISPYAITKLVSENYLYYYHNQYNLNYTVLRYSNVFGPRQVPHGEAGVVSIFIEKLLNNETPVIYAYDDEPEGMTRDYVYVKDVAKANLLALNKGNLEALNISTNKEVDTTKLLSCISKVMNKGIKPDKSKNRPGDLKHSCLSNEKSKNILGWNVEYDLEKGIKETVDYFKNIAK